ncbi:MAG: glycosyltransferase family 4 protein [bacterium]|nr:glycosyltransferase family 4 protein [bacterium]
MENLKDKTLVLFFTCGVSLTTWQRSGILEREIKPYNTLAGAFKKIYFITYGGKEELLFKSMLSSNIEILPQKKWCPAAVYQFLIPLIWHAQLSASHIYKTNQMGAVIPALISQWLYKKKLIVRCGYEWLEFSKKEKKPFWKRLAVFFIEKTAYANADTIVLTSEKDRRFVLNHFIVPPSRIEIIPNYIDAGLFKPLSAVKNLFRVIFVGRLHAQKNLLHLAEAVSKTSYELVMIGSGGLKKEIDLLAKKTGARVLFKANIPNGKLPEELNAAGVFVLPSLYEGCPKALLEAMSCGLPCIGTNVEGIKEIIRHKENGYLCNTDPASIRKAIDDVLKDRVLGENMGKKARQTILDHFDFPKIIEKEIRMYETI